MVGQKPEVSAGGVKVVGDEGGLVSETVEKLFSPKLLQKQLLVIMLCFQLTS